MVCVLCLPAYCKCALYVDSVLLLLGFPYLVFVQTDGSANASSGSNGMVCISLVGEFGCSEEIYLTQSLTCKEKFARGQLDAFFIRLQSSLGEIFFVYVAYLTPRFFQPRSGSTPTPNQT